MRFSLVMSDEKRVSTIRMVVLRLRNVAEHGYQGEVVETWTPKRQLLDPF